MKFNNLRPKILFTVLVVVLMLSASITLAADEENTGKVDTSVSEVIIYPQGVSLMYLDGILPSGYSFYTHVNSSLFTDSVRILNDKIEVLDISIESVDELREAKDVQSLFTELDGKGVKVVLDQKEYRGNLTWFDPNWLMLKSGDIAFPFLLLRLNSIATLMLKEFPSSLSRVYPYSTYQYPSTNPVGYKISWRNKEYEKDFKGERIRLSYLANGLRWKPFYRLYITDDSARLRYYAQITNGMPEMSDVEVKLVAGKIRLEGIAALDEMSYMTATQTAMPSTSYGASPSPSVSPLEEYAVYDLNRLFTLKKGETRLTPLFSGDVEFVKRYVWDARGGDRSYGYDRWESQIQKSVQTILELKNDGETWSHGTVSVYKEGLLTGSDSIEWTPKGRKAKVTIGLAPDIEVKKSHTSKKIFGTYDYDHTLTLWLKNYKSESVNVEVMDEFPRSAEGLEASINYVEKPGNLMVWDVTLNPGEEMNITYTYKSR
ncbi:MAG: DUF4139 domain-containing protein [Candidatus Altiarchaeota archaeon]|nr:DUF4139 domain-containing protein [Candidatus Altiarchaeota archaeon]